MPGDLKGATWVYRNFVNVSSDKMTFRDWLKNHCDPGDPVADHSHQSTSGHHRHHLKSRHPEKDSNESHDLSSHSRPADASRTSGKIPKDDHTNRRRRKHGSHRKGEDQSGKRYHHSRHSAKDRKRRHPFIPHPENHSTLQQFVNKYFDKGKLWLWLKNHCDPGELVAEKPQHSHKSTRDHHHKIRRHRKDFTKSHDPSSHPPPADPSRTSWTMPKDEHQKKHRDNHRSFIEGEDYSGKRYHHSKNSATDTERRSPSPTSRGPFFSLRHRHLEQTL